MHIDALLLAILSLLTFSTNAFQGNEEDRGCDLLPPDITNGHAHVRGDDGFSILISGNPKKFVPKEDYIVTLKNTVIDDQIRRFIGFSIIVEPSVPGQAGAFELLDDSTVQFVPGCSITVIQASLSFKSEVSVRWRAPIAGSACVTFKALVVEQKTIWFSAEGNLTKQLCEEEFEQSEILEEGCQACSEAKYDVVFEGQWSRHTHPKDFPAAENSFSDIIGASHSNYYTLWNLGEKASDGIQELAKDGNTSILEADLVNNAKFIRTVIKARGLKHPNVKTFALFRVDQEHHLLSLVTKITPSPDWMLGVSKVELCRKDGTWVDHVELRLNPWDAGVDDAVTYKDKIPLARHQYGIIRKITTNFPNDEISPFYDSSGKEMNPMAKLIITKKRQYDMPCRDADFDEDSRIECETTEWGSYQPCSVSCGNGVQIRRRHYSFGSPLGLNCKKKLTQEKPCHRPCDNMNNGPSDMSSHLPKCAVTSWSTWSACSVSCGRGTRQRTRNYINRAFENYCTLLTREFEPCISNGNACINFTISGTHTSQQCSVSQWTLWSPCTVTCGKGIKYRTRSFLNPEHENKCNFMQLTEKVSCAGERENCTFEPEEAEQICMQPKILGPCRGYFPRWYFDSTKQMCMQFIYSGCRGNQNNFEQYEDCNQMCRHLRDDKPSPALRSLPEEVIDCYVTEWGEWSQCSATCGRGHIQRVRVIKVLPKNGGKECPKKLMQKQRCTGPRCKD